MSETFATLISRSQETISETLKDHDYNPVSVICGEVAEIVSGLTTADLVALVAERPRILDHKPTEFYQTARWPSGTEILRACVQIEIESGIDMTLFREAVNKWFTHIFRPPQHLISKMQNLIRAA